MEIFLLLYRTTEIPVVTLRQLYSGSMSSAQPGFGTMFRELIELGVVEIDTEPLDAGIERRLNEFWENTSCPRCGHTSVQTWPHLGRVWCRDCNFKPVYTYGSPFHEKHLAVGEVLLAFTLYGDKLLSINQIAPLIGRAYKTVHTAIREVEAAVLGIGRSYLWYRSLTYSDWQIRRFNH